ncbi:MAG TPA: hypothetical protein DIT64_11840 [Verrucomicrobiales bacterium]|nr:hypothetical protein [Verrucomicrobiales bacterium]
MKTLVYIASTGYSGSTLLESILGSNPRFLNLGEIYKLSYWPVCSCGEKVADCAFWRELERRLQQRPGAASSRLQDWHIQGRRSRARWQRLLHDAFIAIGGPESLGLFKLLSTEVRSFSEGCERALKLFETAAAMTGASVIVDSSKDPLLLKHLYALAPDKLRVIHLVRDARAVSHSFVKNFKRDGTAYVAEDSGAQPTLAQAAEYWKDRNRKIGIASWHIPPDQRLFIRYEDLCLKREDSAAALSRFIGEEIVIPETIHLKQQHTIAGNPMRQTETSIQVRLTEDWQDKLGGEDIAQIAKITGCSW